MGSPIPTIYQNCVGGMFEAAYLPWQQSWESVQHTHLVERNFVGTKLALRYRVKNKFYLTALGEYGKESHEIQDILGGGDLWGCALRFSYDFSEPANQLFQFGKERGNVHQCRILFLNRDIYCSPFLYCLGPTPVCCLKYFPKADCEGKCNL